SGTARSVPVALAARDISQLHARPETRRRGARFDEPDRARALTAIRLEQLEHPLVGRARLTGEYPGDVVLEVTVADAHGVSVAERVARNLGCRPRPDPLDRLQASVRV